MSPINRYLNVAKHFTRSVNLEKDYRGALQNGDYILTPTALESLHRLTQGLVDSSTSRAWTITGPYGTGKSAFAVFLTRLLCSDDNTGRSAREQLRQIDPQLAIELARLNAHQKGGKGFLPVLVTARRTPAPNCIVEGIVAALSAEPSKKLQRLAVQLNTTVQSSTVGTSLDTRQVVSALKAASSAAHEEGYRGVLLIIDELGKLFEYAARYPQKGDVYVLQELAEHVSRTRDFPAILVGLLHQSFEEYGHLLDIGTRREWSKIQGRFGDVAFLEPADQVIRMVARAIQRNEPKLPRGVEARIEHLVDVASKVGAVPAGMPLEAFKAAAVAAYPLHPLTLVALPYVFRRFAQNERSLFSYLSSMEPHGFQEFVNTRTMKAENPEFVRLGDLFDYFTSNFGLGLYRQPQALRWLEAADVLDQNEQFDGSQREVVKAVGVLSTLGQFCHLSASAGMISMAISDKPSADTSLLQVLTRLTDASILTYRVYNKSYRIWEGSDVDIEERITEGERQTRLTTGLACSARRYLKSRPMVARRHSFETGALRFFDVVYVDSIETLDQAVNANASADGKVVVCLSESPLLLHQFQDRAQQSPHSANVVFAIPQQIGELRGVITELGALRWVWENTPELRDDRIARREVSLRITEAEQRLIRSLNGLVDPRSEPVGSDCLWFASGTRASVKTSVEVSQLLSDVYDHVFDKSPKIRNELIVRRTLSSAASAARRNLIAAMLQHSAKPLLGIEGYPPERSIYESVLRATGIHGPDKAGTWRFAAPSRSLGSQVLPCWKFVYDFVFDRQPEPIPVVDIYAGLSAPPYGLLDGLHPVLLCAFMMVYPDEVTLYREGTFLPEPAITDFEVMLRRPELYALAGSRVAGLREAVVQRLSSGLNVRATTVPVVRALFRMAKALPEFAWNTRTLPKECLALREAFLNVKSPERFLFVAIPEALELPTFSTGKAHTRDIDTFFHALNQNFKVWSEACPLAVDSARDSLLAACGLPAGESGWHLLRERAGPLENTVADPQLRSFILRVAQARVGREGVESVCALLSSRPPANWSDSDVARFPESARIIGKLFQDAYSSINRTGVVASLLAELKPVEQKRASRLAKNVRRYLDTCTASDASHVIIAALTVVLNGITDSSGVKGSNRS